MKRPTIYEAAAVQGRGLVQVVIASTNPFIWYVVLGDRVLTDVELEDFCLEIDTGPDLDPREGTVSAMLSYQGKNLEGQPQMQAVQLFPCTIMVSACRLLFWISCEDASTLESTHLRCGLYPDGQMNGLSGIKRLQIVISKGILSGEVTWMPEEGEREGVTEPLFREPGVVN